jgi:uncharacterized protein (DUF2267 family)
MQLDEIVAHVAGRTGLSPQNAERTTVVVLQVLCDRLTADRARDLRSQLPAPLKEAIEIPPAPVPMARDDFVARIVRELAVNPEEARERICAVFAMLREAVAWGELDDVLLRLDRDYADLLASRSSTSS